MPSISKNTIPPYNFLQKKNYPENVNIFIDFISNKSLYIDVAIEPLIYFCFIRLRSPLNNYL